MWAVDHTTSVDNRLRVEPLLAFRRLCVTTATFGIVLRSVGLKGF